MNNMFRRLSLILLIVSVPVVWSMAGDDQKGKSEKKSPGAALEKLVPKSETGLDGSTPDLTQYQPQTTCPIMGGAIDKSISVVAGGYKFYACCPMCVSQIKADPAQAQQTLISRGETAELAPMTRSDDDKTS